MNEVTSMLSAVQIHNGKQTRPLRHINVHGHVVLRRIVLIPFEEKEKTSEKISDYTAI